MGWTTSFNWDSAADVKRDLLRTDTWGNGYEILDHASYGSEFYMAVKKPCGEVFIAVYLVKGHIDGYGGTEWGYKDMDSSCFPYYFNCPEKLLKLSTVTDDNSIKWIEECRKKRKHKSTVKKFLTSLKAGDKIMIDGREYKFHFFHKGQPCLSIDNGTIYRYTLRSQMGWSDFYKVK